MDDAKPNAERDAGWTRACEGILRTELGAWNSHAVDRAMNILAAEEHARSDRSQKVAIMFAVAACFVSLLVFASAHFFGRSGAPILTPTADAVVVVRRNGKEARANGDFRLQPEDVVTVEGA